MSKKNKIKEETVIPIKDEDVKVEDIAEETESSEPETNESEKEEPKKKANWKKRALIAGGILSAVGIIAKSMWDNHTLNQYKALAILNGEYQGSDDDDDDDEDKNESEE